MWRKPNDWALNKTIAPRTMDFEAKPAMGIVKVVTDLNQLIVQKVRFYFCAHGFLETCVRINIFFQVNTLLFVSRCLFYS